MLRFLSYLLCILIIYFYIYAPPFQLIPLGLDKFFLVLSYVYITSEKEWYIVLYKFKYELLILCAIFVWSVFTTLIHGTSTMPMLYDLLLLILVIPCSYALYRFIEVEKNFRIDRLIINSAVLASLISLYLILNPQYSYIVKSELLKYPENLVDKFIYRGYGLSDGLLYSYPVIQGFCIAFILLGFYRNRLYFLFIPSLLISVFTNARSGLVPIFVGIIILLFDKTKSFIRISFFVFVVGLLCIGSVVAFLENNEMLKTSFEWSMTSFDVIGDLFSGEKSENMDALLDEMIVWPEGVKSWIIGSGEYIYIDFPRTTDIGYLLRLNFGGLTSLFLVFVLCSYMTVRLYSVNKIMSILLFASLLYLNYKSDFFIVNPASRFFFLVYVISLLNHNTFKSYRENTINKKIK